MMRRRPVNSRACVLLPRRKAGCATPPSSWRTRGRRARSRGARPSSRTCRWRRGSIGGTRARTATTSSSCSSRRRLPPPPPAAAGTRATANCPRRGGARRGLPHRRLPRLRQLVPPGLAEPRGDRARPPRAGRRRSRPRRLFCVGPALFERAERGLYAGAAAAGAAALNFWWNLEPGSSTASTTTSSTRSTGRSRTCRPSAARSRRAARVDDGRRARPLARRPHARQPALHAARPRHPAPRSLRPRRRTALSARLDGAAHHVDGGRRCAPLRAALRAALEVLRGRANASGGDAARVLAAGRRARRRCDCADASMRRAPPRGCSRPPRSADGAGARAAAAGGRPPPLASPQLLIGLSLQLRECGAPGLRRWQSWLPGTATDARLRLAAGPSLCVHVGAARAREPYLPLAQLLPARRPRLQRRRPLKRPSSLAELRAQGEPCSGRRRLDGVGRHVRLADDGDAARASAAPCPRELVGTGRRLRCAVALAAHGLRRPPRKPTPLLARAGSADRWSSARGGGVGGVARVAPPAAPAAERAGGAGRDVCRLRRRPASGAPELELLPSGRRVGGRVRRRGQATRGGKASERVAAEQPRGRPPRSSRPPKLRGSRGGWNGGGRTPIQAG